MCKEVCKVSELSEGERMWHQWIGCSLYFQLCELYTMRARAAQQC